MKQEAETTRKIAIVLFDAHCPLCRRTVAFLMKKDRKRSLIFISMHAQAGRTLMEKQGITLKMDTFVFIKGSSCLIRSDAVLGIARQLGGIWLYLRFFSVIPRPLRDGCYTFLARKRYQWFGKHKSCGLLSTP